MPISVRKSVRKVSGVFFGLPCFQFGCALARKRPPPPFDSLLPLHDVGEYDNLSDSRNIVAYGSGRVVVGLYQD